VSVISENVPYKIRRSDMAGEWYGLDSSQAMLVTLKVGDEGEPARLTITQRTGSSVATKIYDCKDVLVESGQFSLGARGSAVQLTGSAEATWGGAIGVGRGMLTINGPEGQQSTELYFFKARERSWLDDTLAFARQYGLL
jgi:hypothetical protein